MKPASWMNALRAATKVAFATSIAGCGGVVVAGPPDEIEGDTSAETSTETTPDDPPPPPEAIVCEAPSEGWETFDAPTFDCCVEAVQARLEEGPLTFGTPADEQTAGCCAQIVVPNYDALWSSGPLAHDAPADVIASCCELRHGNAGCTPWGPPTPPELDPGESLPWLDAMGAVA